MNKVDGLFTGILLSILLGIFIWKGPIKFNGPKFKIGDCYTLDSDSEKLAWEGKSGRGYVMQVIKLNNEYYFSIFVHPQILKELKVVDSIENDSIFVKVNCETFEVEK